MADSPIRWISAANHTFWRKFDFTVTRPESLAKAMLCLREDKIAEKMGECGDTEQSAAWVHAHYVRVEGDNPKQICMNPVYVEEFKAYLDDRKSWVGASNENQLKAVAAHPKTRSIAIEKIAADFYAGFLEEEKAKASAKLKYMGVRETKDQPRIRAELRVRREVAKLETTADGNELWYIHQKHLPLLIEEVHKIQHMNAQEDEQWIGANNGPRLRRLGVRGSHETAQKAMQQLFNDRVMEITGGSSHPQIIAQAVRRVSKTVVRRIPSRDGPEQWQEQWNWQIRASHVGDLTAYLYDDRAMWSSLKDAGERAGVTASAMKMRISGFVNDSIRELMAEGQSEAQARRLIEVDWVAKVPVAGHGTAWRISEAGERRMARWMQEKSTVGHTGWKAKEDARREVRMCPPSAGRDGR